MNPSARAPLAVAASAGLAHAAASLYWAFGGTWLVDTLGATARGVESLPVLAVAVLVVAALAKGALAVAPFRIASSRVPAVRGLLALLALALSAYGLVLTLAGLLAMTGALGPVADPVAVTGHALLWDPLFAVWGLSLGLGLRRAGGSVVRPRTTAARLGVAPASLLREPALLAGPRGAGGPADRWRRGEGLAEERGDAFARRDAVASL